MNYKGKKGYSREKRRQEKREYGERSTPYSRERIDWINYVEDEDEEDTQVQETTFQS